MQRLLYLLLFVFGAAIFLVHYAVAGQAVYGDGIGYFAHLHSWFIDHDFNYTNEYKHIYNAQNNNASRPLVSQSIQIVSTTPSGRAENYFSPGPAILLSPFYVLANLLHTGSGYGDWYQILTGVGAVAYTIAGLFILNKLVNNNWVVVCIFLATELIYYGSFDVINSHFASFFLTTVFFYVLFTKTLSVKTNLLLGIVAGLLFSTRLQDGVVVLVWLLWPQNHKFKFIWIFATGFLMACLPMFYQWLQIFPDLWHFRYLVNFQSDMRHHQAINPIGSLFNSSTGLFPKAPILLLALITCLLRWQVFLTPRFKMVGLFWLMQMVIIAVQGGWTASAYGGRMYISSLIFFAFALNHFFKNIKGAKYLGLFFIGLSLISISHFMLFEKHTQNGGQGTEQKTIQRLQGIIKIWPK